ncbi:DUF3854 domain-containing protein [Leptolyngbya sp. FACHB-36]|uniref:VapE domain-containing protein n=1 Tax=Leptolyngbya sp. FACHB-36 TaxID=2692808 RepID=UPI001680A4D9|nr:VapE domain-containing protein [Leptolyngbya sp. FACHB-36]MBD2019181.1 DUF3854 domain-containing protein [Leptolyngbya sp. FACHB-36]
MNYSPSGFEQKIKRECIEESAIAPALVDEAIDFIEETGRWEPNEALGWEVKPNWQTKRPHSFGAIARFINEDRSFWQAKPENPRVIDGKPIKYETPVGNGSRAFLPPTPVVIRQLISQRYGVEFPSDGSFWDFIADHPEIPIIVTEGAKKSLCLLSLGYVAIALYGVDCGTCKSQDGPENQRHLIPDLERFAHPDRCWIVAFDEDSKPETRSRVNWATLKLGRVLKATGGNVVIATWSNADGKGVDDLVAQSGGAAWESAYATAIPFEQWKVTHRTSTADYKSLFESDIDPSELLSGLQKDWDGLETGEKRKLIKGAVERAVAYLPKLETNKLLETLGLDPKNSKDWLEQLATALIERLQKTNQVEKLAELKGGYLWSVIFEKSCLCDYLRLIQSFGDRLRFNTLKKQVELDGNPFPVGTAAVELEIQFGFEPKSGSSFPAVLLKAAKRNAYSPIVQYLDRVSDEHGEDTSILEGMARRYFGQSEPIYNTMLMRTLVGAVARAYQPGCKMDTALILQGEQGARKSTFFKVLAGGDEYFDDSISNIGEKDEKLKLHRVWVAELAELETVVRRKDVSATKAFLSCTVDYVRPPYGRDVEEMPRSSVIVGTTNQPEFLSDPTGERRYWVIPVLKEIDIPLLQEERDRVWAAAVALYKRGEQWWLTNLERVAAAQIAEQFQTSDPWEERIEIYVDVLESVTVDQILESVLQIEIGKRDKASQMRVAGILTQMGWRKVTKRIDGKAVKIWQKPSLPEKSSPTPPAEPTPPAAESTESAEPDRAAADRDAQINSIAERMSQCGSSSELQKLRDDFSKELCNEAWKRLPTKAEKQRIEQLMKQPASSQQLETDPRFSQMAATIDSNHIDGYIEDPDFEGDVR